MATVIDRNDSLHVVRGYVCSGCWGNLAFDLATCSVSCNTVGCESNGIIKRRTRDLYASKQIYQLHAAQEALDIQPVRENKSNEVLLTELGF